MRNLVIDELMNLIDGGCEVYGKAVEPIEDRATLEALSNQELLAILIDAVGFNG
jgi:hypothetical protein